MSKELREYETVSRRLRRDILLYKDPLVKRLAKYLESSGFLLSHKTLSSALIIELYKFRVIEYKRQEYLWKAGQASKGIWIILRGMLTFQIEIGGLMVPLSTVGKRAIIGLDHYLEAVQYQSYIRTESAVSAAFLSTEDLNKASLAND